MGSWMSSLSFAYDEIAGLLAFCDPGSTYFLCLYSCIKENKDKSMGHLYEIILYVSLKLLSAEGMKLDLFNFNHISLISEQVEEGRNDGF